MTDELIGKKLKGSSCGLTEVLLPGGAEENPQKTSVIISYVLVEIHVNFVECLECYHWANLLSGMSSNYILTNLMPLPAEAK
jgi:hypothetical protein